MFLHQGLFGQLETQCNEPEDGMQNIEMGVANERVKLGNKRPEREWMGSFCDVAIDWDRISQRHGQNTSYALA